MESKRKRRFKEAHIASKGFYGGRKDCILSFAHNNDGSYTITRFFICIVRHYELGSNSIKLTCCSGNDRCRVRNLTHVGPHSNKIKQTSIADVL